MSDSHLLIFPWTKAHGLCSHRRESPPGFSYLLPFGTWLPRGWEPREGEGTGGSHLAGGPPWNVPALTSTDTHRPPSGRSKAGRPPTASKDGKLRPPATFPDPQFRRTPTWHTAHRAPGHAFVCLTVQSRFPKLLLVSSSHLRGGISWDLVF